MLHLSILDRSFGKHVKKKMTYGALVGCLIIALSVCSMFKPDLNPIQALNMKVSDDGLNKMVMTKETSKPNQYEFQTGQTMTGATSSSDIQEENLKANPNISEQNPTDKQTKESSHVHNISQPKYTHVQPGKTDKFSKKSEPKPTIFKPETSQLNTTVVQSEDLVSIFSASEPNKAQSDIENLKPICNTSQPKTDVCDMSGDIRIDSTSSTVFLSLPNTTLLPEKRSWRIKPYARKEEKSAMRLVREFQVKIAYSQHQSIPHCTRKHTVVGIVFSTSGYSGNHFHAFTDILIPLYLTSREFDGEVKFLVTNYIPSWINKYMGIIQKLSKYELINMDKENEVHCFPKMIVGLKRHKEFNIDPSRSQQSMRDFRNLLREAYSLKRQRAITLNNQKPDKKIPRLLIIPRRRTRSFMNIEEIKSLGKNLGFEVVTAEANQNEARFARIVNSCDVMMGVHGAGLTNIIFLPEKAVFIQILPLGDMDWMAKTDFGEPAKGMDLRYLEYKISENESSLMQQYPRNHPVFRDPHSISQKGWLAFKEVYLDKQNVKLDVGRFRTILLEALKLLHD